MELSVNKMLNNGKKFLATTFHSLEVRNFRLYFIGQAISLCGTWMQTIAQDWLVLTLSNSGTQLGIVSALQYGPILLLGPFGGLIADRFDKRKVLFFTQSLSGILALLLGLLVVTGTIKLWMVYIFAACLGIVNALDNPSRQGFVYEMVGKDRITNAISLFATEASITRAIGPAIAGVVIAVVGLGVCFLLNAASFVAVIIVLALMRTSELHHEPKRETRLTILDGLRYVWSSPILSTTLMMMAIIGTLSYEFSVSLPLFAQTTFNGTAATYAALVTALGLGSVVGGLGGAAFVKQTSQKLLITTAFLFGITLTVVSALPDLHAAVLGMFFVGMFSISFISWGNSTMQSNSESHVRGQVMALWAMAFLGSTFIGAPIIGYIGEHFGSRYSLTVGGMAAIVAAGIGALRYARQKQN